MLINKQKTWSRLMGQLNTKNKLFTQPCSNDLAKHALSPVVSIAKMISVRCPEILNSDSVRICIAGVQTHDISNDGDLFNLLPELLNSKLTYNVDLIGDKINFPALDSENIKLKEESSSVNISKQECLLGEYLKSNTPNVIILLHPGFEEYHQSWLVDDNGIKDALNDGIKVIGASYGDESPIDMLYLNSHGYNLKSIQNNPFSRINDMSFLPEGVSQNIVDWASQTWELETKDCDEEYIAELIPFLKEVLNGRASEGAFPVSSYYTKNIINEDGQWFNIFSDIYVSFNEGVIVDFEEGLLLCEDMEIDVSDISRYKDYPFLYLTLKCSIVHKDYLKPLINAEMVGDEDDEDDNYIDDLGDDGFEFFGPDGMMDAIKQNTNAGNQKKMNPVEQKILTCIREYTGEDIVKNLKEKFTNEELSTFLDSERYSLLHIGCSSDNLALIEFSKELNINPNTRNSDLYSPLDLCVADGGINGLKTLINLYPDIDTNATGAWGFTALHHTKTRGKPDMAEVLLSNGASDTLKNDAGMMYKDI